MVLRVALQGVSTLMVGLLAQLPPWPPSFSFSPSFLLRLPRKRKDFTAAESWAPAGPYDLPLAFFPPPSVSLPFFSLSPAVSFLRELLCGSEEAES